MDFDDLIPKRQEVSFDDLIPKATTGDRAQAFGSQFNRAVLAGIPGMPVDAVMNVADLLNAGYNTVKHAITGKTSDLGDVTHGNREDIPMSSDWIAKQIAKLGGADAITMNRPDDAGSRVAGAAGSALSSLLMGPRGQGGYNPTMNMRPAPAAVPAAMRDAAMATSSGAVGQAVGEATDNPAMGIAASFGPQAATQGAAMGVRGLARGGSEGRAEMQDRLAHLDAAGVTTPSVGMATGKNRNQMIEAWLASVPGSSGVMARNAAAVNDQMGAKVNQLARKTGSADPVTAGVALKEGIEGYREKQQQIYDAMTKKLESVIPSNVNFPAAETIAAGQTVTAPLPGAPNITGVRDSQRGFVNRMTDAVSTDAAPKPPTAAPSIIFGANGKPIIVQAPGSPGGLPFETLQGMKTTIGDNAFPKANQLLADQSSGAAKFMYGGAKRDIENAAQITDQVRQSMGQPPVAAATLDRRDKFYSRAQKVLENVLEPIYNKNADGFNPESAFKTAESFAKNSGTTTQQLMLSMPPKVRQEVASAVVDKLGRALPGHQDDVGSRFSPQTFLSNWNKLPDDSKMALFTGHKGGAALKDSLDSVAKSASMLKDKNAVFPNPSGTASRNALIGYGGLVGGGVAHMAATGNPWALGAAIASPTAAFAGAKLMTNPTFVRWLAKSTSVPDSRITQHLTRLAVDSSVEKDPEAREAMQQFLREMRQQISD